MVASLVGLVTSDQGPDRDKMVGNHAVERSGHVCVAQIYRGQRNPGGLVQHVGLVEIALGLGLVKGVLRSNVLREQCRLALVFRLRLHQRGLRGLQRGLRLLQLGLIRCRLDHEQRGAGFHEGAVLVVDLLHEAFDAADQIDLVVGDCIAGGIQVWRHLPRQRMRHAYFGRRRGNIGVLLLAAGEQHQRAERHRC